MSKLPSSKDVALVGPPALTYTFSNDDTWNTSLIPSPVSEPAYKVETEVTCEKLLGLVQTEATRKTMTRVLNATGDIIATLRWGDILPDRVTIRDSPSMMITSWMKSGFRVFGSSSVSFHDDKGRKYQWKNITVWHQMEVKSALHAEDTPGGPIAAFRRFRVDPFTKEATLATLVLTSRAHEILELCVVSFLFLEKGRSLSEKQATKRTELMTEVGAVRQTAGVISIPNGQW